MKISGDRKRVLYICIVLIALILLFAHSYLKENKQDKEVVTKDVIIYTQ